MINYAIITRMRKVLSLPSRFPRFFIASILILLLAYADEAHQYFTGGRTATIRDVLLDMSGALTFLLILQIAVSLRPRKKRTTSLKGNPFRLVVFPFTCPSLYS
ncbi:VanZ family protein [Sporosarcina sp. P21c]|uniref:VanZ family protein n=1 Tax=Sporosarcina sp. P21c TaxID=2048255 RepID=UPI00117B00DC|nr:VanZ family protein [Sporosarcina sp. P21c]